jgi:hypothetical protein
MPAARTRRLRSQARLVYGADGKPLGNRALRVGETAIVRLQVKTAGRYANGLVVDYIPAGVEIENANIVQGEQVVVTVDGIDPRQAMQNSNIKHVEFRDDRFVVAPGSPGDATSSTAFASSRRAASSCRRPTPKTCTSRRSTGWPVAATCWRSATAAGRSGRRENEAAMRALRLSLAAALALLLLADQLFPPPLPGRSAPQAQVVVARDGTPLRAFPDRAHIWRHPVRIEEVSPRYVEALVAYEDRSFWWHPGVNPWALLRAGWQWAASMASVVSGGSTLTMQVARLLEPTPHTVPGKLRQIARALQLELRLSKREILELYLTFAPMGGVLEGRRGGQPRLPRQTRATADRGGSGLLTVLPQAPSRLRPDRHPQRARLARDKVLGAHAIALGRGRRRRRAAGTGRCPDRARTAAGAAVRRAPAAAASAAARIDSTSTPACSTSSNCCRQAWRCCRRASRWRRWWSTTHAGSARLRRLGRFRRRRALCARGHGAGGALARVGAETLPLRPGARRRMIHSESLLADVPQSFSGYQPGNFQANFSGPVSVSEALQKSLNVPAVEVLERLGPQRFVSLLRRGGLKLELAARRSRPTSASSSVARR